MFLLQRFILFIIVEKNKQKIRTWFTKKERRK